MVITKLYLLMNIGVKCLGFNEVDLIFAFLILLHVYLHFLRCPNIMVCGLWDMTYLFKKRKYIKAGINTDVTKTQHYKS